MPPQESRYPETTGVLDGCQWVFLVKPRAKEDTVQVERGFLMTSKADYHLHHMEFFLMLLICFNAHDPDK